MIKLFFLSLIALGAILNAQTLNVYGPGGPAPAIKELAKTYEAKTGNQINIIAGPTPIWKEEALKNADIFFSGSSLMMDEFANIFSSKINLKNTQVLNIRESGILVRPNNPKKIHSFDDLLKQGVGVLVVDGSGQPGLWEDMALKNGNISNLEKLRKNILVFAKNSAEALKSWNQDKNIDAMIIWKHWQNDGAKFIPAGKNYVIYRAAEIVIANDAQNKKLAQEFIDFIRSNQAQKIWVQKGWIAR
ncbi:hypothetical protein BKH41_06480 [Helicobacter sp. 12S02232-10]|uniref:extracellular solute-binding protein n=1 Tax=Helicobacter sp. 12S02232-10 TaxID=1476197 RepID=UPI000BA4F234|nr:extracellular solute-binding protein [Helicobacter sp. 12S02232-10]PAF47910.1 hypothetical protein BKH41_06480 [Helicobacter sp. 12S02232-10]